MFISSWHKYSLWDQVYGKVTRWRRWRCDWSCESNVLGFILLKKCQRKKNIVKSTSYFVTEGGNSSSSSFVWFIWRGLLSAPTAAGFAAWGFELDRIKDFGKERGAHIPTLRSPKSTEVSDDIEKNLYLSIFGNKIIRGGPENSLNLAIKLLSWQHRWNTCTYVAFHVIK